MTKLPEDVRKKTNAYLKYSGLAFQLLAVMLVGLFLGQWLDEKAGLDKPIITMLLILVLFCAYMYKLYIDLSKAED